MRVRWRLVIGALIAICVLIMGYFYVSSQKTNYAKKVGFMAKNLQLIVYNRINNEKEVYNVLHQ